MDKPNCYECQHRRKLVGDAHSSCDHPANGGMGSDQFKNLANMFKLQGSSAKLLGITAVQHGVDNGWFYWPANYDPTWLITCNGFTPKGGV